MLQTQQDPQDNNGKNSVLLNNIYDKMQIYG